MIIGLLHKHFILPQIWKAVNNEILQRKENFGKNWQHFAFDGNKKGKRLLKF
jgi:hypothetical protein